MLISDWKWVLRYSYSIRLIIIAAVLSGVEITLPIIDQIVDIPRGIFAGFSFIATAGAFIARIVAQKRNSGD
jgi:hypothetical protein